ncbi:MAG: UDP-N-acetylglucosamine 2-epimerase (hydrolyzing) [Agarilytica sp.]
MNRKRIVFLTGTRADFGKLKSLISISQESDEFEVHIFATGMHMNSKYGKTVDEIYKYGFKNVYQFINHDTVEHMDRTLAKTIDGFSHFIAETKPDLIVVHGDRVEALAGAIVGSLNNILVSHIEGGEISGTIDELIRHAVSKMSHIHFVANSEAERRLIQLGEREDSVFVIGSPDLDLMNPCGLPCVEMVKEYYGIDFHSYAIAMFHPVTTEYKNIQMYAKSFVDALIASEKNYIVIYPNNDMGSIEILNEYKCLEGNDRFRIYPSLRFEYFLTLLRNSDFIIGNSSAGIREAPYYNVPTVDVGSRQNNRVKLASIVHSQYETEGILNSIELTQNLTINDESRGYFGEGRSDQLFIELMRSAGLWKIDHQKQFQEINQ